MTTYNSLQDAFDTACTGLIAQGFHRSVIVAADGIMYCKYRGEKGRKCFIGTLISDEDYVAFNIQEHFGISVIALSGVIDIKGVERHELCRFLERGRAKHDTAFKVNHSADEIIDRPKEMKEGLYGLARAFGLHTAVLDAHKFEGDDNATA